MNFTSNDIVIQIMRWFFPIFLLISAPLFVGITETVRSICIGAERISIFAPYYQILSLWKKKNSHILYAPIFQKIGSFLLLLPLLIAILIIPGGTEVPAVITFSGDFILLTMLLSFYRFLQISLTMNSSLPLPMMGASRWMTLSVLTDPIILLSMITTLILSHAKSVSDICVPVSTLNDYAVAPLLLVSIAMMTLILCETGRTPFDFHSPGFETTQIHRLLEQNASGKELAVIRYANALKYTLLLQLMMTISMIHLGNLYNDFLLQNILPFILAVVIGVIDSTRPKTRLTHQPRILIGAMVLTIVALVFTIIATVSNGGQI